MGNTRTGAGRAVRRDQLQSLSRWKGNWNNFDLVKSGGQFQHIAEPIPMKRELKPELLENIKKLDPKIAEPIPMKRELKHNQLSRIAKMAALQSLSRWKGNWNFWDLALIPKWCIVFRLQSLSRWKGNWNHIPASRSYAKHCIAEPIPMKRELKLDWAATIVSAIDSILQSLSRWKGNWNQAQMRTLRL